MGLTIKTAKDKEYLYYQAGKKTIYIGPKDAPSKAKTDGIIQALEHSRQRVQHYLKSTDELLDMLPEPLRKQQLIKQKSMLQDKIVDYGKATGKKSHTSH